MGTFGRYLGNRASAVLMVAVCTACGSSDEDTIEFTGGAAGINGDGGSSGGTEGDAGSTGPCEVSFISPTSSDGGVLTLGAADDVDGTACGSAFSTSVVVSSNGSQVTLFVNGASNSSLEQAVTNLTAAFANVQLSNRNDTPNTILARATMADGRSCEASLGTEVFVDCVGPSCTISRPADNTTYLNAADDASDTEDGFQATVQVETDDENAGQAVRLLLDGNLNSQLSAQVVDESGQGVATFANILLADDEHSVQAECRDVFGNVVNSARVEFTVDTLACTVQLAALPPLITPGLDTSNAPGIQVAVSGNMPAPNADCAELALGICSSLTDGDFDILSSNTAFTQVTTLPSLTQSNEVCARVRDLAGNVGEGQVTASVRVDAPQVAITSPVDATLFTVATDENPASGTCEVDFQVDCEDVGSPVQLLEGTTLRATANCDLDANVSAPYHGRATFNDVTLASRDDGTLINMTARQAASDLTGTSNVVTIGVDCQAPQPSFANSVGCGGLLSLVGDDNLPGTPGLQFTVSVLNDGAQDVTLTITRGSVSTELAPTSGGSSSLFEDADLGVAGDIVLSACATDPQGNTGCVDNCEIEIADVPAVNITSPLNAAILTTDCDTNVAGFQVRVQGTTDAVNGSSAVITVGSTATPSVPISGGQFDACVNAPTDGPNQTLTVAVTDLVKGPPAGSDSITVTVDGQAPTQTLNTLAVGPFQRRQGIAHFTWTAVPDEGGGALASYEMRCATATIDDETEWTAATPLVVNVTPAASGSQSVDLSGFRVGTTRFCALRGRDFGGTLTPLPSSNASIAVNNAFLEQGLTVPAGGGAFASVAPIGDIDGDGFRDIIYGSVNASARVFFGNGGGTAPNGTHDIEITGIAGGLGAVVAGLGDISGDGRPDFAVSARAITGSRGAVYVFFGKATNTWNANLTVNAANCGDADICFLGSEAGAFLGWDMTSALVNGDAQLDLVITAYQRATVGRVYVILGGAQLGVGGGAIFDLPGAAATLNGFIIDPPTLTSNFGIGVASVGEGDLVIAANGGLGGNDGRAFFATEATSGTGLIAYPGTLSQFDTGGTLEFAAQARPIGNFNSTASGAVALGGSFNVGGIGQIYPRPFSFTTVLNFFNDGVDNDWSQNIGASFHPAFGLVGDLDKDTFAEFAVGAFETGSVDLFYGGATSVARPRSQADFHRASAGVGAMYPNFVGDINGDTFNDLAVIDFGTSITDTLTILY